MRLQGVYSFDKILNIRSSRAYKSINSSEETGCIARCTSPFLEDKFRLHAYGEGYGGFDRSPGGNHNDQLMWGTLRVLNWSCSVEGVPEDTRYLRKKGFP